MIEEDLYELENSVKENSEMKKLGEKSGKTIKLKDIKRLKVYEGKYSVKFNKGVLTFGNDSKNLLEDKIVNAKLFDHDIPVTDDVKLIFTYSSAFNTINDYYIFYMDKSHTLSNEYSKDMSMISIEYNSLKYILWKEKYEILQNITSIKIFRGESHYDNNSNSCRIIDNSLVFGNFMGILFIEKKVHGLPFNTNLNETLKLRYDNMTIVCKSKQALDKLYNKDVRSIYLGSVLIWTQL